MMILSVQADQHWTLLAAGPEPAGEDESGPVHLPAAARETRGKSQQRLRHASQQGPAGVTGPAAEGMLGGAKNPGGAARLPPSAGPPLCGARGLRHRVESRPSDHSRARRGPSFQRDPRSPCPGVPVCTSPTSPTCSGSRR